MYLLLAFLMNVPMQAAGHVSVQWNGRAVTLDPPPMVEQHENGALEAFVSTEAFAMVAELDVKSIKPGRLLVLCKPTWCRPVHLNPDSVRVSAGKTLVDLRVLADACGMRVKMVHQDDGSTMIQIESRDRSDDKGDGRLSEGSMLPDVELTDLEGQHVRLSRFLGKRMLICTWASW